MFHAIESGDFGSPEEFKPLIESIRDHGDYYLVTDDFDLFWKPIRNWKVYGHHGGDEHDKSHMNEWVKKSVLSVANMGFFLK